MAVRAPAYRRMLERIRAAASNENKKMNAETKQNKRNAREKDKTASANQNMPEGYKSPIKTRPKDTSRQSKHARRIQVGATCGQSTMASEPARARLLRAFLSLVLPVKFGHTCNTACRSPAPTFSAWRTKIQVLILIRMVITYSRVYVYNTCVRRKKILVKTILKAVRPSAPVCFTQQEAL